MKKSTPILLLFLLAALLTLACVVALRCSSDWREKQGLTFDVLFSSNNENSDPRVKELDDALKQAKTERQKVKTVLVKRSNETRESLANLARAFKEFDKSEREAIKNDFNSGKLSSEYEGRADVVKAFVLYQEIRTLKRDEDSLRALYDKFDVVITRAESERANILRQTETSKLLGEEAEREETDNGRLESIDRLVALAEENVEPNATEDSQLLPSDVANSSKDLDSELLRAVVDASNSDEDVETFLNDSEQRTNLEIEETQEEKPLASSPILAALKSILFAVVWGGCTTAFVFAIGFYYLICPVQNIPTSRNTTGAPFLPIRPFYKEVGFYIFIALTFYGWNAAKLPGLIGLGFIGLLIWRVPVIIRRLGVFRFVLLALLATFIVFLILVALAIL